MAQNDSIFFLVFLYALNNFINFSIKVSAGIYKCYHFTRFLLGYFWYKAIFLISMLY